MAGYGEGLAQGHPWGGRREGGVYWLMPDERIPAIKVLLLPKDTNAMGTIFGGVILSNVDLASAVEARKHAAHRYVTKAMREVEFHEPVFLGDIVSFYTHTVPSAPTPITVPVTLQPD